MYFQLRHRYILVYFEYQFIHNTFENGREKNVMVMVVFITDRDGKAV